jgi:hypothetical protein
MDDDRRLTSAARLVLDGKLSRRRESWWVESESRPGVFYRVGPFGCACGDWARRQPASGCKHMVAVRLAQRAGSL